MSRRGSWAALAAGGALAVYGARRRDRAGALLAVLGVGLAARGAAEVAGLAERLGVRPFAGAGTGEDAFHGPGVRVERTVVIDRPIEAVYRFWRDFENLPRFMRHLVAVRPLGRDRYRWVARAPVGTIEWDAQIIDEQVPWRIAWRSVPGSRVRNAGSVHFTPAPDGRGTEVTVSLAYRPPAGVLGAIVARLMGEEPSIQVRDDLERFKRILESDAAPARALAAAR